MPYGLEILIPKKTKKGEPRKKENVFWIEVKKIKPNPFQPRKEFSQKELKELAISIEKYGILQPLLVRKIEKAAPRGQKVEYHLIAGERRLRAALLAGMKEAPVIIEDIKTEDELPISLIENLQREDLNPLEKALAFKRMVDEFNLTQKEIAKVIGKSREAVANTLRLLELDEEIKKAIAKKEISEGHARALLSVGKEKRMAALKEIIEKKLPVREIEKKGEIRVKKGKEEQKNLEKLKSKISKILGTENIKIEEINGKIKLTLTFDSRKKLEEFLSSLRLTI